MRQGEREALIIHVCFRKAYFHSPSVDETPISCNESPDSNLITTPSEVYRLNMTPAWTWGNVLCRIVIWTKLPSILRHFQTFSILILDKDHRVCLLYEGEKLSKPSCYGTLLNHELTTESFSFRPDYSQTCWITLNRTCEVNQAKRETSERRGHCHLSVWKGLKIHF